MKIHQHIKDYIKSYDFLPEETCKDMISFFDLLDWGRHSYYAYDQNKNFSYDDDLYVNDSKTYYNLFVEKRLYEYIAKYINEINYPWFDKWNGYTNPRFNKYPEGTNMKTHIDHIHSIFDGKFKGIPTLTLLGFLNEDFEGGDFYLCGKKFPTKTGQLIIFPSNLMYPHEVKTVTKGIRYSFVSWVW